MTGLVDALWGCGDLDRAYTGHDLALVPWPAAARRRGAPRAPQPAVDALLAGPPYLTDVDPRTLRASQRHVVAHHARYYATGAWPRTGLPSADRHQAANQYPLVLLDERGDHVLLGGHHRALVALVEGRPLRARVLRPTGDTSLAVLPTLLVGRTDGLAAHHTSDPVEACRLVTTGSTVAVDDLDTARAALAALGLGAEAIAERLTFATTGRLAPRTPRHHDPTGTSEPITGTTATS